MTAKEFNIFENIFEFSYAEGCPYYWPFIEEDDVDCYAIKNGGYIYKDWKTFLKQNNIFAEREAVFEEDSESSSDEDYYGEEKNQERQKLLAAKIETWPFEKIVCSCIFYTLSKKIKEKGHISYWNWEDIMPHLTSDVIGPELLLVIKRNGFFELNPQEAIRGTLDFFNNNFFWQLGGFYQPYRKSNILRILESIQVDPKVAEELTTQTLQHKDTRFITTFLKSYSFPQARCISQKELESYLKCLELTSEEKTTIAENARDTLENSSESWTTYLSTWDEYTFAITLDMEFYDQGWTTQQNKNSTISIKETYLALSKLKEVMHVFKNDNLRIISYPPISLVEKFLKTDQSELNSSIIKLLFPPEKVNKENTTISNWALMSSLAALFLVLWSRGYNIGLGGRDNKFASISFGAMSAFPKSLEESRIVQQVRPAANKSVKKVKELKKNQSTLSQSKQSPSSQSVIDSKTNLKVSTYNKGYLLTGNYGPYNKLKTKTNNIKANGKYGLPHPQVKEEIDHLLMSETRVALVLSPTSGSSQDKSTAIIVPAFFNKNRTCISSRAFTRSVSYDQPPDFIEYTKSEVESSVKNLSSSTFRGKEQSASWAAFQEMADLDQIKQSYYPAINQLANELNEKVIKRYGIEKSLDAFLIRDVRILHARWCKDNQKILNAADFTDSFEEFDYFVCIKTTINNQLLEVSQSAISYLDPNKPITLRLTREQNRLASTARENYQYLIQMHEYEKKQPRALSLETTIVEMETKIHFPIAINSNSIMDLDKLNEKIRELEVHTPYPKRKA